MANPPSEKKEHKITAMEISRRMPFSKNSPDVENGEAENVESEPVQNPPLNHDNNSTKKQATDDEQSSDESRDIIVTRIINENIRNIENVPNISLNCHKLSSTLELWIVAIVGTILQLGVVAYWALATYYPTLQYSKDDKNVADYAYPCAAAGTFTLVVSMMLCSHVVESRTTEKRYVPRGKAHDIYFCWLQQEKVVNDQSFNSHIIYCKKKNEYIIKSERDGEESRLKTLTVFSTIIALSGFVVQFVGLRGLHWSASVTQLGIVLFMLACKAVVRRGLANPPESSGTLKSGFELEWLTKVLCEIIEPRQERSPDLSQDPAVRPPQDSPRDSALDWPGDSPRDPVLDVALSWLGEQKSKFRPSGHQSAADPSVDAALAGLIRWLRRCYANIIWTFLNFSSSFFWDTGDAERSKNRDPVRGLVGRLIKTLHRIFGSAGDGVPLQWFRSGLPSSPAPKPEQITGWVINHFGKPELRMKEPIVESLAHSMMTMRRDLGRVAAWRERPSKEAIAVTKSIEIAMNTLFSRVEGTKKLTYWSMNNSKDQEIDFQIEYKNGRFTVDYMEMDAILSLWLFADSQQYAGGESKPSREDGKTNSWLRSKGLLPGSALCLIGPYSAALHRDIWWWMPTKENPVLLVQTCQTGNAKYDATETLGERYGRVVTSVTEYDWVENPETRLEICQLDEPQFDEESAKPEGFLATEKKTSLELVYAQHIFSAFMRAAAADESTHIKPSKTTLRTEDTANGGAWKSLTVLNETLSKVAIEIQQTGLGSLEEVYQSILPPLSLPNKLPQPDEMIELARKEARVHQKAGQWEEAGKSISHCCAESGHIPMTPLSKSRLQQ